MVRSSSEEVRVEILEAEDRDSYWNLRDIERTDEVESKMEQKTQVPEEKNSLRIEFDLKETREITEDQKQVILDTLTSEEKDEESDRSFLEGFSLPYGLIALIALLAFFALVVALSLGGGGHYYW